MHMGAWFESRGIKYAVTISDKPLIEGGRDLASVIDSKARTVVISPLLSTRDALEAAFRSLRVLEAASSISR
jgi:hypothetical protein